MDIIELKEIGKFQSGGTPSKKEERFFGGNIPWITTVALNGEVIDQNNATDWLSEEGVNKSATKIVPPYSLMIGTRVGVGKVAVNKVSMCTNQDIISISHIDFDKWDIDYLRYFIKSVAPLLNKQARGATIQGIKLEVLQKLKLPIIEIENQRRISRILENTKRIIDKKKSQLNELDDLIKSQFVEMFGDPFVNPKEYDIIPFDKLVEYMGDIGSNGANSVVSANLIMSDTEDYALMIRTTNFTNNDFVNNVKYVSKEVYDFFKKSQVFGGELIFNKIGSAGINFVMPNLNRPVSLGLNQIMVRINDKVCMTYLHNLLNTEYGKYQINSRVQGAVTKSITKGAIKELPILLPPIELQNHFATFVQQVDKLKFEIQKSLDETQILFESLMQKYFG